MFSLKNTKNESGSALVVAMIVLAILTALGMAGLEVADLNIFMSANDRDSKNAFFLADSGVNVGHEQLEELLFNGDNASLYEVPAAPWRNETVAQYNATNFPVPALNGTLEARVRYGELVTGALAGSASQIGAGHEGSGKGAAHGGTFTEYLIRSHRTGQRNSVAEVDIGWRHINY